MNDPGPVHGNPTENPPFHEIDDQGADADLGHVTSQGEDHAPTLPVGADDGPGEVPDPPGPQDAGEGVEERRGRPLRVGRGGEVLHARSRPRPGRPF